MAEHGPENPILREHIISWGGITESILEREGEKAPTTEYRISLALDFKKKIKIID